MADGEVSNNEITHMEAVTFSTFFKFSVQVTETIWPFGQTKFFSKNRITRIIENDTIFYILRRTEKLSRKFKNGIDNFTMKDSSQFF